MNTPEPDFVELSNGEIQVSIQGGSSIHLRAVTLHNDPVELSTEEARELARLLLEFADRTN